VGCRTQFSPPACNRDFTSTSFSDTAYRSPRCCLSLRLKAGSTWIGSSKSNNPTLLPTPTFTSAYDICHSFCVGCWLFPSLSICKLEKTAGSSSSSWAKGFSNSGGNSPPILCQQPQADLLLFFQMFQRKRHGWLTLNGVVDGVSNMYITPRMQYHWRFGL